MTLFHKFPRRSKRRKLFLPLIILLIIGAVFAKPIYHILTAPNIYKPNGQISYTTPISKIFHQGIISK